MMGATSDAKETVTPVHSGVVISLLEQAANSNAVRKIIENRIFLFQVKRKGGATIKLLRPIQPHKPNPDLLVSN
jgi:hypothetical protein